MLALLSYSISAGLAASRAKTAIPMAMSVLPIYLKLIYADEASKSRTCTARRAHVEREKVFKDCRSIAGVVKYLMQALVETPITLPKKASIALDLPYVGQGLKEGDVRLCQLFFYFFEAASPQLYMYVCNAL